jgi:hypothetical protein
MTEKERQSVRLTRKPSKLLTLASLKDLEYSILMSQTM